jgi:hypothetical protein
MGHKPWPAVRAGLCLRPRARLVVCFATIAAAIWAAPAAAQVPNLADCTGYAQPRVPLESQSWWSQGAGVGNSQPGDSLNGRDEHAHVRVCVPHNVVVSGTVRLDLQLMLHETPTGYVHRARIQDRDRTLVNDDLVAETKSLCAGKTNCEYTATYFLNTSGLSTGRHEFRFHHEMARGDGARALATNGWHICIRSCSPEVSQAVTFPVTEGRSKWVERTGTDYGYNNARLVSGVPWSGSSGYRRLSGTWCPHIRTLAGAGGRPVVRSFVSVDPRWHDYSVPGSPNGYPGRVYVDEPNAINRQVCIDTRQLSDGLHRLFMRGDGQAATGKQGGVYLVPFFVANGG